MRSIEEVIKMATEAGITISDNVKRFADVKTVNNSFNSCQEESVVPVYQKKKGKATKKVTAWAVAAPSHISKLEYAMMTSDVDLRELFRKVRAVA